MKSVSKTPLKAHITNVSFNFMKNVEEKIKSRPKESYY